MTVERRQFTKDNLPLGYTPFDAVTFCSNRVEGGGLLLTIGDVAPLLVGKGTKPLIWLQALVDPKNKKFETIVEASISKHPAVNVFESPALFMNPGLKIAISGTIILNAIAVSASEINITDLDLRPVGINVWGNTTELKAGGMTLSKNTFSGVGTMLALG